MSLSSIGPFPMIALTPFPSGPNERLMVESRAGTPGSAVWKLGAGGQQFKVKTIEDTATFAAAAVRFQQYETLIGAGPVVITYGGITLPYLVVVLDVSPDDVSAVLLGVGGVSGAASYGQVRASWTLLPWSP